MNKSPWTFRWWNTDLRSASREARKVLAEAGFSVGRRQRGAHAGILFGDYDIMKWRNLRPRDREMLHGKLFEDAYPVSASFPSGLPDEVEDALLAMNHAFELAAAQGTPTRRAETTGSVAEADAPKGDQP